MHSGTHQPPPSLPPPPSVSEMVNRVQHPPPPIGQAIPQVRTIRTVERSAAFVSYTQMARRYDQPPRAIPAIFHLPPPPNLHRELMKQRANRSSNSSSGGGGRRTRIGSGPCGVPLEDKANGYRRYANNRTELNEPIDRSLMQTEFDFESNLALFDKNQHRFYSGDEVR